MAKRTARATSSPPPAYNFAFTPVSHGLDTWWDMKRYGQTRPRATYVPIHMPRNTGTGVIIAGLSTICGFALVWYIWWLAALSFAGIVIASIIHTFNYARDYHIPAEEVRATEDARDRQLASAGV